MSALVSAIGKVLGKLLSSLAKRAAVDSLTSAEGRNRLIALVVVVAGVPVALLFFLFLLLLSWFGGSSSSQCMTGGGGAPSAPPSGGMYASPLKLKQGSWYEVGATEYGGPGDPTSSTHGSIGGSQGYLPAHPDTFAELSVLDSNPANSGTFTFADANALNNLPYLTPLIVANNGTKRVLYKRDVGYGQGPGQFIGNGQPYRLDLWWQSARPLGVSKSPVQIALAPPLGAGNVLQETPPSTDAGAGAAPGCDFLASTDALQLTPGERAHILPDGSAAAPQAAPRAVKLAIAAGNEIHTMPYPEPDTHFGSLMQRWPAYDCSGAASYVLYKAGLHSSWPDVSGTLEHWGASGPGKWISVYANSEHAWVVVAGLAFDTANFGGPNIPAGSGPRWRQDPTANTGDGLSYVVRHPPGL